MRFLFSFFTFSLGFLLSVNGYAEPEVASAPQSTHLQAIASSLRAKQTQHPIVNGGALNSAILDEMPVKSLYAAAGIPELAATEVTASTVKDPGAHILNPAKHGGVHPIFVCLENKTDNHNKRRVFASAWDQTNQKYLLGSAYVNEDGGRIGEVEVARFERARVKQTEHETLSLIDFSGDKPEQYALFYESGIGDRRLRETYKLSRVIDVRLGRPGLDTCSPSRDGQPPWCTPRANFTCLTNRFLTGGGPWIAQ